MKEEDIQPRIPLGELIPAWKDLTVSRQTQIEAQVNQEWWKGYYAVVHDLEDMRASKDAAYEERNRLVAALASLYPAGLKRTNIKGWDAEWHGCVYIDLPTGQASWHYHDSQAYLFDGLPPYTGEWDGHTTEEKYLRVAALRYKP